MATLTVCGNFTKFSASTDDPNLGAKFTHWLERFENDLVAWGIKDDCQKKALLISNAGPDNPADYPSRHPSNKTKVTSREEKVAEEYVNFISHHTVPVAIDLEEVKRETLNDHTPQRVIKSIRNNNWHKMDSQNLRLDTKTFKSFQNVKDELTVNARQFSTERKENSNARITTE